MRIMREEERKSGGGDDGVVGMQSWAQFGLLLVVSHLLSCVVDRETFGMSSDMFSASLICELRALKAVVRRFCCSTEESQTGIVSGA